MTAVLSRTDGAIDRIGKEMREESRRARMNYRRFLAESYTRDTFFRTVTPDVVGFELYRLGQKHEANNGSVSYTELLIKAMKARLLFARQCLWAGSDYPLPGARLVAETLRIAILGELGILRRQCAARLAAE